MSCPGLSGNKCQEPRKVGQMRAPALSGAWCSHLRLPTDGLPITAAGGFDERETG
jgi:hypothetical protein